MAEPVYWKWEGESPDMPAANIAMMREVLGKLTTEERAMTIAMLKEGEPNPAIYPSEDALLQTCAYLAYSSLVIGHLADGGMPQDLRKETIAKAQALYEAVKTVTDWLMFVARTRPTVHGMQFAGEQWVSLVQEAYPGAGKLTLEDRDATEQPVP